LPRTNGKKLILAIIDGLTPAMLERGLEEGRLPALGLIEEAGTYTRGTTTFPSVTPVCLTSIATGAHPDVHEIPHLVWYHREEERVVEYGSSFAAVRAAGTRRSLRDSVFAMTQEHLAREAVTVFEALEDEGASFSSTSTSRTQQALDLLSAPGRKARSTRTRPRSAAGSSREMASTSSSSTSRTTTTPPT